MPFKQLRLVNLVDENVFVCNLRRHNQKARRLDRTRANSKTQAQRVRDGFLKAFRAQKARYASRPRVMQVVEVLPEGAAGASQFAGLAVVSGDWGPRLFVYGGLSSTIRVSLLEACAGTGRLAECFPWKENSIALGRYGHSVHAFKDRQLLVFGGYVGTSRKDFAMSQSKLHGLLGLFLFHTRSRAVTRLADPANPGPQPRKFHASCLVAQRFLLVFGGVPVAQAPAKAKAESKSASLCDLWVFDSARKQWLECALSTRTKALFGSGMMFHKMVSAYNYSAARGNCFKGGLTSRPAP